MLLCAVVVGVLTSGEIRAEEPAIKQPITIGLDANYAPLQSVGRDGIPRGYDVDFTRALMSRRGIQFYYSPNLWAKVATDVLNGTTDLAMMVYSPYRKDTIFYSRPIFRLYYQVVYRKTDYSSFDFRDIQGKTIAFLSSRHIGDQVKKDGGIGVHVYDLTEAFNDLAAGKYDAVVCYRYQAKYYIEHYHLSQLQAEEISIQPREYCYVSHNKALIDAIKEFLDNKEKYQKLSYPYSFSALLYGHPGCGKSSTILAVASALNKDIQYVNLAKLSFERFLSVVNNPDHDIIVFEDIDAINASCTRKRSSDDDNDANDADLVDCPIVPGDAAKIEEYRRRNGGFPINDDGEVFYSSNSSAPLAEPVTADMPSSALAESITSAFGTSLSDLLNVTDGLLSSDGSICIFTTNHIERLDPALLRAGRMNKCIEFTLLNAETAGRMIETNLGYKVENLKDSINPAELQEMILHITLGSATKEDLVKKFCITKGDNR